MVQEVISSIHVVKAFTREDYEQTRLENASLESVYLHWVRGEERSDA